MTSPDIKLDQRDKALMEIMQEEFPVAKRPFEIIGNSMGISESEVLSRVKRLVEQGTIRKIQGAADKTKLGLKAKTLVGMKVPPERVDEVMEKINQSDGVTHNYERTYDYNVWYVIEAKDRQTLASRNEQIRKITGIEDTIDLPGLKNFKLRLKLDVQ